MIKVTSTLLFTAFLCGCSTVAEPIDHSSATRTELRNITAISLAQDYQVERAYRPEQRRQPSIGLALSGGGTKAAMFAHGVLHGLHNQGVLEEVDAISSVSGGSYAAYWYFTKMLAAKEQGFALSEIFEDCVPSYWTEFGDNQTQLTTAMTRALNPPLRNDPKSFVMPPCAGPDHLNKNRNDPYRWQAHLVRWPDIFETAPVKPDGEKQGRPERIIIAGVATGLFIEPIRQLFHHQSAIPNLYQYGIERTWGLNPEPRSKNADANEADNWTYSNGDRAINSGILRIDAAKTTWSELRKLYTAPSTMPSTAKLMPLWIANTNSAGKTPDAIKNVRHIFEMTPFGYGNQELGYINNIDKTPIMDLGTSVRASAGFADAQGIEAPFFQGVIKFFSYFWPGARWGVPAKVQDPDGTIHNVHLSDGGGAENLGLYSLLKRGLNDIIVVDAAQDETGSMKDLCEVKKALFNDGVTLVFQALKNLDEVCNSKELSYNVSDWRNPVLKGIATWSPVPGQPTRVSTIWLIKAAWHQQAVRDTYNDKNCGDVGRTDCFLTVFYGHNSTEQIKKDPHGPPGNMVFPQLPTTGSTANSSSYLFWGYRELGRSIARNLSFNSQTGRIELDQPECSQPAVPKRGHERPYELIDAKNKEACVTP